MATYEEIYGKRVKEFDSDPTLDSTYEGQVWYDKSSGTLRTVTASIAAWASQGPLLEARSSGAGFGISTAAIAAGGSNPPLTPSFTNNSQIWDGTNWTNTPNLNNNKSNLRGWGSSTNGAVAGGRVPAPSTTTQTEEWNGTSWVTSASLGTAGYLGSTAGGPGAPSGLYAGGGRGPGAASSATEEFTGETTSTNVKTITSS